MADRPQALAPDPELMRRVRRIEIRTRQIVTETLAGSYHSAFRGQGMEFAEVREYRPGDDVRSIDWNVTSRSARPERSLFVKVFKEERELSVILLADASGSTAFGSGARLKREVMAELGALLAFAAIRNRDRVGLLRFSAGVDLHVPPRSGRTHALRVVREILSAPVGRRRTNLASALETLTRAQRKPAVAFLITDLLGGDFERALKLAAQRHDIVVFEVVDPRERHIPALGPVLLEDPETGERRLVDTSSRRFREDYSAKARERRERAQGALRRAGVDRVTIDASRDYDRDLLRYFRARAARARR
jgi:uncharacterized protein (DUF58 family)